MSTAPMLTQIIEHKRAQLRALQQQDVAAMRRAAAAARSERPERAFSAALRASAGTAIIAEVKRSSPSAGNIRAAEDAVSRAISYVRGGAAAISVLTEESHFGGSLDDLRQVSSAVAAPVLRKDFIFGEEQIYEAAIAGASAILLITALLTSEALDRLRSVAELHLHMDALVEVHTEEELRVARQCGATLIGVNNRNLATLTVSLDVSRSLAYKLHPGELVISESGISTRDQIDELETLGYRAFLIGESLMRADDPEQALAKLVARKDGHHA